MPHILNLTRIYANYISESLFYCYNIVDVVTLYSPNAELLLLSNAFDSALIFGVAEFKSNLTEPFRRKMMEV